MDELERTADHTTEQEVRPGLTMRIRRTLKPDGRYLIYYDFSGTGEQEPSRGGDA